MNAKEPVARVRVAPTKAFFVSMLTKDIELADAILDLIDNCLDGVLRQSNESKDYASYYVEIIMNKDKFVIADNCGGIDRETAIKYAFRMGRDPSENRDDDIETIGMYGIGMKRAIFKTGFEAEVRTRHLEDCYSVFFTTDWMSTNEWDDLPLFECEGGDILPVPGTRIEITHLHPGVASSFSNDDFMNVLKKSISDHFVTFLERGFTIKVNGTEMAPSIVRVLVPETQCRPFYAEDYVGQTKITVIVGVNTRIFRINSDEDEDPAEQVETSLPEAGWTIFCNDRAIVVGDKSRLTGWGIFYPSFHPQFAIITGMVHFESRDATGLPITTTKRALDTSSETWEVATGMMTNAMKPFIQYTTAWKNVGRKEQHPFFETAEALNMNDAARAVSPVAAGKTRGRERSRIFDPQKMKLLPKPAGKKSNLRRVVFSRPNEELEFLGGVFFGEDDWTPAQVGDTCFALALEERNYGKKG